MLENDQANGTVTPAPDRRGYSGYSGGWGYSGCSGYQNGGYQKRKNQQLEQEVWELRSQASEQVTEHKHVLDQVDTGSQSGRGDTRSRISQVTIQEGSIMSGRSDQTGQR